MWSMICQMSSFFFLQTAFYITKQSTSDGQSTDLIASIKKKKTKEERPFCNYDDFLTVADLCKTRDQIYCRVYCLGNMVEMVGGLYFPYIHDPISDFKNIRHLVCSRSIQIATLRLHSLKNSPTCLPSKTPKALSPIHPSTPTDSLWGWLIDLKPMPHPSLWYLSEQQLHYIMQRKPPGAWQASKSILTTLHLCV